MMGERAKATALLLQQRAKELGFEQTKIYVNDGISGTTFQRKGFLEILDDIKKRIISTVIVKDMSRLGRNYIEVGQLTETVFPMYNVRFIAVNDGVDSEKGEDDFTPFRNIMNEWYAKDMSRKMRTSLRIKSKQGYAIGAPPYGYKRSEDNPKVWVMDEEAAKVVRHIYKLRIQKTEAYRKKYVCWTSKVCRLRRKPQLQIYAR